MKSVMITSGTSFEGFDIVAYGEYRFTQTILNSNFLKDFGTSIADIATDRSEVYQEKLDGILNKTIQSFKKLVGKTEYNAVIGFQTNVAEYSNNLTAVVASGTLVKLEKQYRSELTKSGLTEKEVLVSNYYDEVMPRAVKLVLVSEGSGTKISAWFHSYNNEDIRAVKADIEFVNLYGDATTLTGVDFTFDNNDTHLSSIQSDYIDCKLPEKYIKLISSAKVYIKKYVTSREIYLCSAESVDIVISPAKLKSLKAKAGMDAVGAYKADGLVWRCNCGHINEGGAEECVICHRKQDDMKKNRSFDYEPMIAEMETKEFVIEIKDVLMKYIKDIDAKLRMQLLEIMESGIQYEKIRGSMKDTVIEKVEKLFLEL